GNSTGQELATARIVPSPVSVPPRGFSRLAADGRPPRRRWSGVCATVAGQIRTGDVRGLRTSHERYQRGAFVNRSVAVERCIGLLGRGPIARGGIQIRVDRTRLDIVDRDAPRPHLPGQPLSEHL